MRGPATMPGPLSPTGVPRLRNMREEFDSLVLSVVRELEKRWKDDLGEVEFAVEETPLLPDDWDADTVPLASMAPGTGGSPTRLVLFRRPIELRCETKPELAALVFTVLVEQVSEFLGRPPEEIDPRYEAE
ncbi:MAG TPA: metallopeptidase family protein [Nocardioidaceae bacterium]|nr:metallopeptidase family protein [Nocardioidaceae bacterium]